MNRIYNSDLLMEVDSRIYVQNFKAKFWTQNKEYFYISRNFPDKVTEDGKAYFCIDWNELYNIGQGVLHVEVYNNFPDGDFKDGEYNRYEEFTTDYYIYSKVYVGDATDSEIEKINKSLTELNNNKADLSDVYTKAETYNRDEINKKIVDIASGGEIDLSNYYTKAQTYSRTEVNSKLDDKLDVTAYTPTDLSGYYTKAETFNRNEVNDALGKKLDATAYTPTDLSSYSTTSQMNVAINNAVAPKANASDVYTKTEIDNKGYLTEHQSLSAYSTTVQMNNAINDAVSGKANTADVYTKSETDAKIAEAAIGGEVDLSAYAKTVEVNAAISSAVSGKANSSDVYTKSEVDEAIQGVDVTAQLTDYAKTEDVNGELAKKLDATAYTPTDLSDYSTTSQMNTAISNAVAPKANAADVYTKTEIDNKGYLTEHQSLTAYSTTEQMNTAINNAVALKANTADVYAKTETYSKSETDAKIAEAAVGGEVDLSSYAKTEDVNTAISSAVAPKANAADVYTKDEVAIMNAAITSALDTKANAADVYTKTEIDNKGYLTEHQSLTAYSTTVQMNSAISNAVATKADVEHVHAISGVTGLRGELDAKANSADVYTKSETYTKHEIGSAIINAVEPKANASDVYTKNEVYTKSEVDNAIAAGGGGSVDLSDYSTTVQMNDAISNAIVGKANSSDVYTKTETYSKAEVDAITGDINAILTEING